MIASIPPRGQFRYSNAARLSMVQVPLPSTFDRNLASTAGRSGLVMHFDPADFVSGAAVLDRASLTTWAPTGGTADPAATTINGQPALQFTQNTSRIFVSSTARAGGSFTIMLVREQTPTEASAAGAVMIGSGPDLNHLVHARQYLGSMRWFPNTGIGGIPSTNVDGTFMETFTYDTVSGNGKILDKNGGVIGLGAFGTDPATGYPIQIGGWDTGYGFGGKIGRVLVFNQDLSLAGNAATLAPILALMRSEYGL